MSERHEFARIEAMEARLLFVGTTLETFDLSPRKTPVADGFGNHLPAIVPAVLPFSTSEFGRLDTTYAILDPAGLGMSFALLKDVDGSKTQTASDTKIGSPTASSSYELAAGNYLYIVTPTTGAGNAVASVRVTLKSTPLGPAKIEVTGYRKVIGDGDTTPSISDFTDFGTVPVGVINVDRTFVVRNTGGAALTLGAIGVPAGFAVKAGLPATLAPGASASFTLTLGTATARNRSGTVSFKTNDATVGTFSFNVAGAISSTALPAVSGLRRLRINGTAGSDTIALTQNATRIIFTVNANTYSVLKTKITRGISVDAQTGDDMVTVSSDITLGVLVAGAAGNDSIVGASGNDTLLGLDGDDTLRGGAGADSLDGGNGVDTVDYTDKRTGVRVDLVGDANDGNPGENDLVLANNENILGSGGNDTLMGTNGPNLLNAGAGNDFVVGFGADDTMFGGAGNDTLRPGTGNDIVRGQGNSDVADYSDRTVALALSNEGTANDGALGESDNIGTDIERLIGGSAGDFIELFVRNGTAHGFGGADKIFGTLGNDQLFGGDGNDTLFDGEGNDTLAGEAGDDEVFGGLGNDTVTGGAGADNVNGGPGNDSVDGGDNDDSVGGGSGDDIVHGGNGNDQVFGYYVIPHITASLFRVEFPVRSNGEGNDQLFGDAGNDTLDSLNRPDGQTSVLLPESIPDTLDGGDGTDTANKDVVDLVSAVPQRMRRPSGGRSS